MISFEKNNEWVIRAAFSWSSIVWDNARSLVPLDYPQAEGETARSLHNLFIRLYVESNEIYAPLTFAGCFVTRSYYYLSVIQTKLLTILGCMPLENVDQIIDKSEW